MITCHDHHPPIFNQTLSSYHRLICRPRRSISQWAHEDKITIQDCTDSIRSLFLLRLRVPTAMPTAVPTVPTSVPTAVPTAVPA